MDPQDTAGGEAAEHGRIVDPPRGAPDVYAEAVLAVTGMIPPGHVLTYGDIAELLGCGGPRQVGRALSHSTRSVPWWRVLRAGGHPASGLADRARPHYDDEATPLRAPEDPAGPGDYRVDLGRARWWPTTAEQTVIAGLGASRRSANDEPRTRVSVREPDVR
ncbi:cysteine methyltransferase [Arthrobacter echini]|uniref:Cysteine methyltransferase n=1 Tax=Arthrobacter echini TaxID=1529066 RepID=A0A4V3Z5C1_9MICC|nr:MGMT family protein [Arthrobacter echini]THJ66009.1 cysteine methyltransferase [Arthrobacter echini]